MTQQQHSIIARIDAQLEAQRFQAEQASRPALTLKEQAISLYDAMIAAKDAGDLVRARELATELKPLLNELD